jgi:hypothetical protein
MAAFRSVAGQEVELRVPSARSSPSSFTIQSSYFLFGPVLRAGTLQNEVGRRTLTTIWDSRRGIPAKSHRLRQPAIDGNAENLWEQIVR